MAIYNVKDYGAVGNGLTVDKSAIQAAINAAHAAGGGDVYIPTGVYLVEGGENGNDSGAIHVLDNVNVYGDGMGLSVIKVKDGWDGKITGVMRTPYAEGTENISVSDLTLDGNRANTTGKIDGWFNGYAPGQVGQDTNVTLDSVEIKNMSGYGFDPHEQTYDLVISNSVSHGNGLDGFVADFIRGDSVYENNLAYGNDRHGFNIVTSTDGLLLNDNIAYGNGGAGIVVQRGSEDIELVRDVYINGGEYYNNAKEGVQIKISDNVVLQNADIYNNGLNGVRIYGSTDVVVENNNIFNNSQSKHNGYAEIRIQEYDETDGVSGLFFAADGNIIRGNTIYSDGAIRSTFGIEELMGKVDYNLFFDNSISGSVRGNVQISGAHTLTSTPDIIGTDGNNVLPGNAGNNLILAQGGNDSVNASSGNDTVYGGAGNDTLFGSTGNDVVFGGEGNDTLGGNNDNDTLFGGTGNDFMQGGSGDDSLDGGSGDDSIEGNSGNDFMEGWYGNDTLIGNSGLDTIYGGHGNDVLSGFDQQDILDGGEGKDTLTGGTAVDIFKFSELGHSVLVDDMYDHITDFSTAQDKIDLSGLGFTGLDTDGGNTETGELRTFFNAGLGYTFVRSDQTDFTFALTGNFTASLNNSHFIFTAPDVSGGTITGGTGNDVLSGTGEDELLLGLAGDDSLTGAAGNDTFDGGAGKDTMVGGTGADVFKFSSLTDSVLTNNNYDRITDFEVGVDEIDLSGLGFTGLDTDGGNTETGELRLVYSTTSGRTYVRSDQSTFEFYLNGDYRTTLSNGDFIFDAPPPPSTTLTGGAGNDTLTGTGADELLLGMDGNDSLVGGAGNDTLDGGAGKDTIIGGAGADIFTFSNLTHSVDTGIIDRIVGFELGVDKLDVSGLGFTGLDADGGNTEVGEFRLAYSASSDRTYVRSDQSSFEFYLDGDFRTTLTNGDFIF